MQGSGLRVQGAGCMVQGSGCRVLGAGFRVQDAGCRALSAGFGVRGSGCFTTEPLEARKAPAEVIISGGDETNVERLGEHVLNGCKG